MKKISTMLIMLVMTIMLSNFVFATISCNEQMSISSQSNNLVFTASSVSGTWGASIQATSTGCTFPSGSSSYKTVMLSEDGNTKTIAMTIPQGNTCIVTGDYEFGTCAIKQFSALTITIAGNQTCTPDNSCASSTCTTTTCTNNCGQSIQGTKVCTTSTSTESWFTKELFPIGTFSVKGWMLLAVIGGVLLFAIINKR